MKLISRDTFRRIIPNKISLPIGRQILVMKKNSPHIFFTVGVVGAVGATILACRATLKLSDTLDEIQHDLDSVKEFKHSNTLALEPYQEEQSLDSLYVYLKASGRIAKLYAPAIIVGGVSIAFLTGSHVQLSRRNAALMAAYAALQQMFEEYRERVKADVGEEHEKDIYHGTQTKVLTDEDGNERNIRTAGPLGYSIYAKFFDEVSPNWQKDPEFNRMYIQCQQKYANDLLRSRGHVFLNEVYDMLGIDRTTAGSVVGWVMNGEGDNYISFGVFEMENAAFINGYERSILLDFNVDGIIYDKI